MRTPDGSRSPQRSSSPCRGSTPPISPRKSCMTTESEDVWPEDFEVESGMLAQNKKAWCCFFFPVIIVGQGLILCYACLSIQTCSFSSILDRKYDNLIRPAAAASKPSPDNHFIFHILSTNLTELRPSKLLLMPNSYHLDSWITWIRPRDFF